ncbi:3-dehydroquinate synthase [Algoriphagus halophilus]|uniref:3-dehydroquinate synthase n=1 Tax=Algoriphagus halophilus TaxID=226505 RepID=A0A1N6DBQ9_9BACT|nr:3-dehydroquinate synthase [Algoriphagus halophilus]SIN68258.1 3-dehydroquinate synthase [Algoriphagus halophilus]
MDPVIFSSSIASDLEKVLQSISFSQLFVLTDQNTEQHCLPKLQSIFPPKSIFKTVAAGEKNKNLSTCSEIWSAMTEAALDRKALFINIGGGVIGDMGGFCASIYKRGIRFINIPTTLLSQVDASVGGKLGVDFEGLKNHLGTFNEPETVMISPEFLETLPEEELRSGYAEIIKHGLIQDKAYFEQLNVNDWKNQDWKELIQHSVGIKKQVVLADPKEAGLRKILNYGHTIGHAFESHFLDTEKHLLHGEAIAIGMICEGYLSLKKLNLSPEELDTINHTFLRIYGKFSFEDSDLTPILNLCLQDKKNEGSVLMFSLLEKIGTCTFNIPVTRDEIEEAILYYKNLELS